MAKVRKILVLVAEGEPIVAFTKKPTTNELMNYVGTDDPAYIKELFRDGELEWSKVDLI